MLPRYKPERQAGFRGQAPARRLWSRRRNNRRRFGYTALEIGFAPSSVSRSPFIVRDVLHAGPICPGAGPQTSRLLSWGGPLLPGSCARSHREQAEGQGGSVDSSKNHLVQSRCETNDAPSSYRRNETARPSSAHESVIAGARPTRINEALTNCAAGFGRSLYSVEESYGHEQQISSDSEFHPLCVLQQAVSSLRRLR